jgi:hypothetical protein
MLLLGCSLLPWFVLLWVNSVGWLLELVAW